MYFFLCNQGYKPPDEGPSEYQTIPLNKIEDFGVHCKQYVALYVTKPEKSLYSILTQEFLFLGTIH